MIRLPRIPSFALLFAASLSVHAAGPTGLLNDTGQDTCYDGAALVACTAANSGDAAANPRQDGRFGRDAAAAAGQLTKTGAGAKGFDYTKICFNGNAEGSGTCTGTLVANTTATATATPSTDWACTRDNVTNLIWSLQSGQGDWTIYASTTLPTATNAATRCGYNTGWRLPTRRELLSIAHNGAWSPAIDSAYFPATQSGWYWSADIYASDPAYAWVVDFGYGYPYADTKADSHYVRLVRSGQ
ncbi:MAG: DUF1566 domain-containing protein [Thiobacillus sp.]|nr:DUF1566 domain-containing protein [Thiobacillus sp.]MDP2978054.1 DUF1566 domain-containing protein [Thiobacillus sp.]